MPNLMARLAEVIDKRASRVLLVALILAVPVILSTLNLKVDQNFRRLLPDDAPEVQRLKELQRLKESAERQRRAVAYLESLKNFPEKHRAPEKSVH